MPDVTPKCRSITVFDTTSEARPTAVVAEVTPGDPNGDGIFGGTAEDSMQEILRRAGLFAFSSYGEQLNGVHLNQTLTGVALGAGPA